MVILGIMIPLNWKTDDTPASTYTGFGDLITNDTEVTISEVSGKTWYVIANDSSTVTLLSKESFGNKAFEIYQDSKRGGYLHCELLGNGRIAISGEAVLVAVSDIVVRI